jgi:hypothetical protein
MATTGLDGKVKVFDVENGIEEIMSKDMKAEKLYCGGFYPDNPWLLGAGSGLGEMVLWDLGVAGNVANRFGKRSAIKPHMEKEEMIMKEEDEGD